ncbi:MAG: hypothetical protein H2212_04140 [Ruminococcus sp.]|nr:hypothetical protein [Ruminococcus sp.]
MNRKKILTLLVFAVLIIGVFALVNVIEMSTTEANTETGTEADITRDSTKSNASSTSSEKKAAEELIGETISREEIEENVGKWEEFEMSSAGCERGVYAGKFYYEEFTIFSRTYNKGKTFRIVSVNE